MALVHLKRGLVASLDLPVSRIFSVHCCTCQSLRGNEFFLRVALGVGLPQINCVAQARHLDLSGPQIPFCKTRPFQSRLAVIALANLPHFAGSWITPCCWLTHSTNSYWRARLGSSLGWGLGGRTDRDPAPTFWGSQPTDRHIFICAIRLCLRIPREIDSGYGFRERCTVAGVIRKGCFKGIASEL